MTRFDFVKMHGCGNDYVLVDTAQHAIGDPSSMARRIADRHTGIGSDGLILTAPSETADVRMIMFNADGSRGSMCGNGLRCVARCAIEDELCVVHQIVAAQNTTALLRAMDNVQDPSFVSRIRTALQLGIERLIVSELDSADLLRITIETDARVCNAYNVVTSGRVVLTAVEVARPSFRLADMSCQIPGEEAIDLPIRVAGREYRITCVEVGNLQAVCFVDDLDAVDVERNGRQIAASKDFPDGVNMGFAQVLAEDHLRLQVYERGSGITMACGSGACAAVVAANRTGRAAPSCRVDQPGGSVIVVLDDLVVLCGDSHRAFSGRWTDEIARTSESSHLL